MRCRPLGRTGLLCSEIGFGAWQLGNVHDGERMSDRAAHELVETAVERGITLFDTAPHYAATHSERLLGEALARHRDHVVLVSKFGHTMTGGKDFAVASFWNELEGSLRRLRTDRLDVLLLHNPPFAVLEGRDPIWDALERAKAQGRVLHYGASVDFSHEVEVCLKRTGSSVFEVLFNVLHQEVRRSFSSFAEAGAGVIVKVPLDSGWLTGRFDAARRFGGIRARWSPEQIARRAQLVTELQWLSEDGRSLTHKALAYVLSYDAVSCAIPGTRTLEQLHDNVASNACVLRPEDRRRLEQFWEELTGGGENLLPW